MSRATSISKPSKLSDPCKEIQKMQTEEIASLQFTNPSKLSFQPAVYLEAKYKERTKELDQLLMSHRVEARAL